jgi:hypothetical protein
MMYQRLVCAAVLLAAFAPSQLAAVDLILSTTDGTCTVPLQSGSNVSIDPATGNVFASVASGASCPQLAGAAPLSVTKNGTGSGTVTSSPTGISCGSTCSANFPAGSSVSLSASAASGSAFAGWSGDCTGTGACNLTMNQARSVTATFNTATTYSLSVTKTGSGAGTVTSSPSGISCGSTCSASFAEGTSVSLTASPASGSTFTGWSGACSGTGGCSVTMSQARSVSANFDTSTIAGCENVVAPTGYALRTSTSVRISNNNFTNVDATRFSRLFRSADVADVPWPGNDNTRWVRNGPTTYLAAQFTVPTDSAWNRTVFQTETSEDPSTGIHRANPLITLSRCPGDFDAAAAATALDTRCVWQPIGAGSFQMQIVDNASTYTGFRCPLQRGTTYYMNLIFRDKDTGASTCGHTECSWFGLHSGVD